MLNVSFNIVFIKVTFFSISHSLLYHLYLPYDLFLNESVFVTIKNFLLFAMINILTISRAEWTIAVLINKWTITVSINEKILIKYEWSWMNIATIFMNAATDKRVLQ